MRSYTYGRGSIVKCVILGDFISGLARVCCFADCV